MDTVITSNAVNFQCVDHFKALTTTLRTFSDTRILTDMTLISGALKIHIHRHMLAAFTSFFSEFLTNDASNCYIIINDVKEGILEKIVELIYYGRVSVQTDLTNELYKTMDFLKLHNFQDLTVEHCDGMISLTCTYHADILLNNLLTSRTPTQSDVVFVSNDFTHISVHSFIIGAKSKYMLNIFLKHTAQKKPLIFILQNVTKEHLESVLEFCYKGSTSIAQEDLQAVYEVALLLGIDQLCEEISQANPHVHRTIKSTDSRHAEVISRIKTFHSVNLDQAGMYKNRLLNVVECEHLVDVTLMVNRQTFNTHGVVLSEFSPYFRYLSKNLCTMRDSFVLIKDISSEDIKSFVEYIYTGETEFLGRPSDFCSAMKDLIDFDLLPICESKECQILSQMHTIKTDTSILEEPKNEILTQECTEKVEECSEPPTVSSIVQLISAKSEEQENCAQKTELDNCETMLVDTVDDLLYGDDDEDEDKPRAGVRKKPVRTCYSCGKNFETMQQLSKHMLLHPDGRIMKCKYCGKGFDKRSQLTLHLRTHTGARPFQCGVCGRGFAAKSALVKHNQIHSKTQEKLFVCADCNKSFSRKEYLEEHIRTHTGDKPFECPVCHKKFVGRTGLNHHKKVHDGARGAVCEVCGKSFTRHALWTHKKTHDKVHQCTVCQKNFATSTALNLHVSGTHLGHRSHQCEVCGKGFVQKSHLVRHIKLHKEGQTKKLFHCDKCSRSFGSELKLGSHLKKEHSEPGDRPYSCSICHKKFAGRSTAMYHRRGHTGERPHACNDCGKTFVRPDALSQHVQTHAKRTSYECIVCNKRCTTKSALQKHTKSHPLSERLPIIEELKTILCIICNQSFQSESQLSAHSLLHDHETSKRFQCGICDETFPCQESLTKHNSNHPSALTTTSDLPGIYAFQVCEQTYSQVIHTYTSNSVAQSTEGQLESHQQFGVSVLSNSNACIIPETPAPIVRRPYSITIDGNLCCNTDIQSEIIGTPILVHPEIVPVLHKLQPHVPSIPNITTGEPGPLAMIAATVANAMSQNNNDNTCTTLHFNTGMP